MSPQSTFEQLRRLGVVPVVALERPADALKLADALADGGLPVVEVTFRTAAAAQAIKLITLERPQVLVGAGTVLTLDNLETAKHSGAAFAVAPGFNPQIVRRAAELDLPFIPGIATPSDIEAALTLGCKLLKFFPAEALGGIQMLEGLSAPYRHTGVSFLPTGGINPANLEWYLRLDTVAAVGGTWLAKREDLSGGCWEDVRTRCQAAVHAVAGVRAERRE